MKHLKRFNELYDSEESRTDIDDEELKRMVSMDFKHKHEPGKWFGKNSADLNIGISDYTQDDKHTKFNRYGILDILNKKILKAMPEMQNFKLNTDDLDSHRKFSYKREIVLDVENLDDDYIIQMNLWVKYNFKEDDILEYAENTIGILFSPVITTNRISVGLGELGGIKGSVDGVDISDKEVTRVMFKLDKLLNGTPDKEDEKMGKLLYISGSNLSLEEFDKQLLNVKENLAKFSNYVYGKYGIKII